ncbi:MAG: hypothetical protein V4510_03965 [bacterium]
MNPTPLAVVFLLACAVLAGCAGAPDVTPEELASHTTPLSAMSGMQALPIGASATEFKDYGMTTNPGTANPAKFPNFNGATPKAAYGEILQEGNNSQHRLYVFALSFSSADAAAGFVQDGKACGNPNARAYTKDGATLTQFVYVALDGQTDNTLIAHWHSAIQDVMARTGATNAC